MTKKYYFASDFHFGIPDLKSSKIRESLFIQWLDMVKVDAEEIFLLGDLFDFWFEYQTVIPKGYSRLFGKLTEITDSGIPVHFFKGNHDMWAFKYLEEEIGMKLYNGFLIRTIEGKKFFITHGDGLGPGDHGYKFIKKVFANRFNQKLFNWLHPDLGIRLALFWSGKSRYANIENEKSEEFIKKYNDIESQRLAVFSRQILEKDPAINYFVYGHWHRPLKYPLSGSSYYIHLGDWLTHFSYGVFDGNDFEVKSFINEETEL